MKFIFNNFFGRTLGRIFVYVLIAFLLFLLFGKGVKADTVADFSTSYHFRRSNSTSNFETNYRPDSDYNNMVKSYGTLDSSHGYYNYIVGFKNKINANFYKGLEYFIKTELVITNGENMAYHDLSNDPMYGYGFRYHDFKNRIINNSKVLTSNVSLLDTSVTYNVSNCYEGYDDLKFCDFHIFITQRIYVKSDITQLIIGSYNTSDMSIGFWKHLYDQDVSISNIEYVANVDSNQAVVGELNELNQTINNSTNNITNNQQTIIQGQQGIIDSQNELNNTIKDDNISGASAEANNFFNSFQSDTFGLTSIITAPLNLITSITSSSCSALPLSVPFLDNVTMSLPCFSSIYEQHFGSFLSIYQTITFGIVAYWVCVKVFALVKDFKDPDNDKVEVIDL